MKRVLLTFAFLLSATAVFAQEAGGEAVKQVIDWGPIAAAGIGVLTMVLVQVVKVFLPGAPAGLKQILALVAAPALTWAASKVSGALGYPVDFASLIEAITAAVGSGLTAMGMFDVLSKLGVPGLAEKK